MRQVNIIGNSHTAALRRGLAGLGAIEGLSFKVFGVGSGSFETEKFSYQVGDAVHFSVEHHRERMLQHTESAHISRSDVIWGVCMALYNGRVYKHAMWREYEPAGCPVGLAQVVSDAVLRQIIESDFVNVRNFFLQLKQAGVPAFAISPPGPRPDQVCIERGTRPGLVLYLDRRYKNLVLEFFEQEKIDVILPPSGTHDENGFLKPEYFADFDQSHANERYGELMMRQVVHYLSDRA